MSLDVYLDEIKACPHCGGDVEIDNGFHLYSANITHNLGKMASEAGIYQALWRPEEIGITRASGLIEPLQTGLAKLLAQPDHYKQFNAENGWGLYEHFVPFVEKYLAACEAHPTAKVSVWR